MRYYQNLNLKHHNSFGLESVAKEIWFPENGKDLIDLILQLKNDKFYILSRGTNVLLNKVINKVVCLKFLENQTIDIENEYITVDSNCLLQTMVKKSISNNLGGFEGLKGIPGTVGSAIVMNAGSKDYAISDCLISLVTLNRNGDLNYYKKEDLNFSRRYSIIQDNKDIIVKASFKLKRGVNQEDLKYHTNSRKNIPHGKSAGGIFVNWHELKPYEKKLIGLSDGDAIVSDKVNVIINKKNATCDNILNLIDKIKNIVKKPLKLEIKMIGFDNDQDSLAI